ncbi:hypothetical protein [Rhizobium anhuiense]|uniref:hypothetical protein n=1 Tax=Rhizobium anhuiense TaxID=1184720 RepID=UPI000FC9C208|nr:hypothetical protein [Rhizobium anhuiense]
MSRTISERKIIRQAGKTEICITEGAMSLRGMAAIDGSCPVSRQHCENYLEADQWHRRSTIDSRTYCLVGRPVAGYVPIPAEK